MGLLESITDGLGFTNYSGQQAEVQRGAAQFAGLKAPTLTAPELQRLVSQGELTPEQADIISLQGNAYNNIQVDPRLLAQQQATLGGIQEVAATGMTEQDKADLSKIAGEEATAERGSREALIQQAQMKGVSGSGVDLASQLVNQQAGATRRSARDTEVAGQAGTRRLSALEQAGQLAGQMHGQQYNEQAAAAQAQNYIEQFNVQNQQSQLSKRAQDANAAKEANLRVKQDIANQNTGLTNREAELRSQIPLQQFQNEMDIAKVKAGGNYSTAQMYGQQSQSGMQGVGALAGAAALAFSDENVKENIKLDPSEMDNLLEHLSGYSFNYKPEEIARGVGTSGKKVGLMAQDVKKIMPRAVNEVSDGEDLIKVLNNAEILPAVLASVGRIHDRLKKVEGK